MKRFLLMITALSAFFAAIAENPMVTLSHDGELSFFTNLYAFNSALNAAKNGDTIYLSEGVFVIVDSKITIDKRVSIVGTGYGSHILGEVFIDMHSNPDSFMSAPLFDGVRIDKLSFYKDINVNAGAINLGQSEIRRCWIGTLEDGGFAGIEVTIDKCWINSAHFYGPGSVSVKNSKIVGRGTAYDGLERIKATNCNISNAHYYPVAMISCIFKTRDLSESGSQGSCSIFYSLLDQQPPFSDVKTYDCYIYNDENQYLLDDNLDCPLNLTEAGYLGQDGTVVGIFGGDTPFSENPSVPTVNTASSSVEYDAENDKLKVSIAVKAD